MVPGGRARRTFTGTLACVTSARVVGVGVQRVWWVCGCATRVLGTRRSGVRGCRDLSRVVFFASVNICPPGPREKRQLEQYASNKS